MRPTILATLLGLTLGLGPMPAVRPSGVALADQRIARSRGGPPAGRETPVKRGGRHAASDDRQ